MKISTRITGGFTVLSLLALACGWAGYYGVSSLSKSLTFISGAAWDTADGSMEGAIGVEAQMLGANRIVTQTGDQEIAYGMIKQGQERADTALQRMVSTGLLDQAEIERVNKMKGEYTAARDDLLAKYEDFSRANKQLSGNFYEFQKLMEQAEELGDGAVETLRNNPNMSISWNSGLKNKWSAADGAMETQIGMLQRSYYYQRLINGVDKQDSLQGLSAALDFLNNSIREIIDHPVFKNGTIAKGPFQGMSFSNALQKAYNKHQTDFSGAIQKYTAYRSAQEHYNSVADGFLSHLDKVEELGDGKVENEQENIASTINTSYSLVTITVLLSFGIAIFAGGWIVASIVRPMREVLHAMEDVAEGDGDLQQRLKYQGNDEIGQTVVAFNKFIEKIEKVIIEVRNGVNSMEHSAGEIVSGNTSLSQRTEEQASSLEETASSMEEMTSTVKQNAQNAVQANTLALDASKLAQSGGAVVDKAVRAMREINDSSKKIADIISVIDDIAFQTNLLALNAAVEAARAGEQGRGFAVVASEVRTLAQRSADQSKQIKELILASVDKVEQGSDLVNQSGESLKEIVVGVKKVSDIISEIAAASQEQSAGIEQVNKAVMQMDEMTQQNAALVEQAAAASQSMDEQARHLQSIVSFFKVSDSHSDNNIVRSNWRQPYNKGINGIEKPKHAAKHNFAQSISSSNTVRQATGTHGTDVWEDF